MDSRFSSASESFLRRAVQAGRAGGSTALYFWREGHWEASNRQRFALFLMDIRAGSPSLVEQSCSLLRKLSADYRTRYRLISLPIANDIVLDAVTNLYRKDGTNFRLLSSSDSERSAIESMMIECLAAIRRAGCARPYSLTSKYWHFLLPEAFPIYDKQVASAIETWSRAAFDCQSPDGFRMSVRFRQGRTTDTSGSGYRGVLDFYHLMWEGSSADLRAEAHEVASALEGDVRRRYGTELARITVLDLIDKYLWRAFAPNGRCGQRVVVWTDVDQGSRTAEAG